MENLRVFKDNLWVFSRFDLCYNGLRKDRIFKLWSRMKSER